MVGQKLAMLEICVTSVTLFESLQPRGYATQEVDQELKWKA